MGKNLQRESAPSARVLTCPSGSPAPSAAPDHPGAGRLRGELTTTAIPMGYSLSLQAGESGDMPKMFKRGILLIAFLLAMLVGLLAWMGKDTLATGALVALTASLSRLIGTGKDD